MQFGRNLSKKGRFRPNSFLVQRISLSKVKTGEKCCLCPVYFFFGLRLAQPSSVKSGSSPLSAGVRLGKNWRQSPLSFSIRAAPRLPLCERGASLPPRWRLGFFSKRPKSSWVKSVGYSLRRWRCGRSSRSPREAAGFRLSLRPPPCPFSSASLQRTSRPL